MNASYQLQDVNLSKGKINTLVLMALTAKIIEEYSIRDKHIKCYLSEISTIEDLQDYVNQDEIVELFTSFNQEINAITSNMAS